MELAAASVRRALDAGILTQRATLSLPPTFASDLDDWPGGDAQRLEVLRPLADRLLRLLHPGERLAGAPLDADDEDHVVLLQSPSLACVLLASADSLAAVRRARLTKPLLFLNASWCDADFGAVSWLRTPGQRGDAALAAQCVDTFSLESTRIRGQTLRVLRAFPSGWRVFAVSPSSSGNAAEPEAELAELPAAPAPGQLERLVTAMGAASPANADLRTRLAAEMAFNTTSLTQRRGGE